MVPCAAELTLVQIMFKVWNSHHLPKKKKMALSALKSLRFWITEHQ